MQVVAPSFLDSALPRNGIISYNRDNPALITGPAAAVRPGKQWGVDSSLPFRKKALYYGLMLLLTVLALEGMARIAYYAAYGQAYGGGPEERPADPDSPLLPAAYTANPDYDRQRIRHPFYGFTDRRPGHALNRMPPRQRREDTVVIGVLGGSVAEQVQPFLQDALRRYFAANNLPRQPATLNLAVAAGKQPQQVIIVVNNLQLGGEFDLIVNMDGFNELVGSAGQNADEGLFPFFPTRWHKRVGLTAEEVLLAGSIGLLRQEQARRARAAATSPLRRSAVFGLIYRYRQERVARQIVQQNRELAATEAGYILEKHGPRSWPKRDDAELLPAAARVWYRNAIILARLAELAGADYYHFLQPNQYVADSKPLSPAELAAAYERQGQTDTVVKQGYPLLQKFARSLQDRGVNYFDLTGIFAAHPETLYIDECCHLNERGLELLAAEMTRLMEPALRRLGGETPNRPVSELDDARRPTAADALPLAPDFRVYLAEDQQGIQYVRADCAPEDTEAAFFLHLTPRDLADLPPDRREFGFDSRDFNFYTAGGEFRRGQCVVQIPLPDYPLAYLRTGQYVAGAGEIWVAEYPFPE